MSKLVLEFFRRVKIKLLKFKHWESLLISISHPFQASMDPNIVDIFLDLKHWKTLDLASGGATKTCDKATHLHSEVSMMLPVFPYKRSPTKVLTNTYLGLSMK